MTALTPNPSFPHGMVFRIFDNILATGVEALFGFGLVMLQKNEEKLLAMKFEEMAVYLNNKIFDTYRVRLTLPPCPHC